MKHNRWNRRRFLRFGLSTLAGGWMMPRIVARRALAGPGRPGANDVLRIGVNWRLWQKDERKWEGKNWRGWDMWRDYSGHLVTNWGAHAVDIVQWALGMDGGGPVEVGPLPRDDRVDSRACPMAARYADGIELRMNGAKGVGGGGIFYGERGSIAVDRNRFRADPPDLITDPTAPSVSKIWNGAGIVARPHIQNWIDCIKSRSEPNAPVEVGHRTVTICHLFNIARQFRRQIKWDPDREVIVGDDEANALLDRPRRVGWELPSDDTTDKAGTDR